jgi:hypothetical protein
MNADENGIWINEVEFDVPTAMPQNVDLDRRGTMMRAAGMVGAVAFADNIADVVRCDVTHGKQVLIVN